MTKRAKRQHEQPALFEPTDADAFFLDSAELTKRYTAAQVRKIESVRELVLMAVSSGWPVEDIASAAHLNTRTVLALAARDAEKVAGNIKGFSRCLHGLGARWYALARAKEDSANFIQLAQAASFAVQRGSELLAVAAMGEVSEENVVNIEPEQRDVRARLLAWAGLDAGSVPAANPNAANPNASRSSDRAPDMSTGESVAQPTDVQTCATSDAVSDAFPPAGSVSGQAPGADITERPAGAELPNDRGQLEPAAPGGGGVARARLLDHFDGSK